MDFLESPLEQSLTFSSRGGSCSIAYFLFPAWSFACRRYNLLAGDTAKANPLISKPILVTSIVTTALLCPIVVRAAETDAAKAFLVSVYHHYLKGGRGIPLDGPGARKYFDLSLLALIRRDVKANGPGEVGVLDYDPVCSCQDWDELSRLQIDLQMQNPNKAVANVSFALTNQPPISKTDRRAIRVTLISEHSQWRIYDLFDISDPKSPLDLRDALEKEIRSLEHNSSPKRPQ